MKEQNGFRTDRSYMASIIILIQETGSQFGDTHPHTKFD